MSATHSTRRFVRMFKPRFATMVSDGRKQQTVRPVPTRMPKVGDVIDCRAWSGLPYRSKHRALCVAPIIEVSAVSIFDGTVAVAGSAVRVDEFANADGFEDSAEMFTWFEAEHGLLFTGILIGWDHTRRLS